MGSGRPARRYVFTVQGERWREAVALDATRPGDLRDGLGTVTRGTLLVVASAVCLVLFTFVSRVLLVRSPSADWNSFSLELTLAAILGTVGTLGLPDAVARSLPHATSDAERRTIVRVSILATVASAFVLALALWLTAPYVANALGISNLRIGLELFSIAVSTSLISVAIAAIFRGYANVIPNALYVQVINPGLFLVFLLVALGLPSVGLSYTAALIAYAAANAVTLLLLVAYAVRRLPTHLPAGSHAPEAGGRLLRFTAPLFVATVALTLSGTADTIVLGVYHSSQVGLYTASLTLARLVGIGVTSAAYIFMPVATRFLRRENPRAVRVIYATVTKWLLAFSLPLFLLFTLLPHQSLRLVYGASYSNVVTPLLLTVVGAFLATVLGPAYSTLVAYGRVRLVAANAVVAGLVDVGLALVLVPAHGYVGAAAAWAISTFVVAALCLVELAWLDGVHPFRRHFNVPLLVTSIPVALGLFLARGHLPVWGLPVVGLAIAGVFVLVVLVTRSVDEGDRALLEVVENLVGRPVPLVRRLAKWTGNR